MSQHPMLYQPLTTLLPELAELLPQRVVPSVGTPEQVSERMEEFTAVGVDLVLLQSSPQAEEMERFGAQVIRSGAAV